MSIAYAQWIAEDIARSIDYLDNAVPFVEAEFTYRLTEKGSLIASKWDPELERWEHIHVVLTPLPVTQDEFNTLEWAVGTR